MAEDQGVGVLRVEAGERRDEQRVGPDVAEQPGVGDAAGHHRALDDPPLAQDRDRAADLAEAEPLAHGRPVDAAGRRSDLRTGFVADGEHGHLVAELPCGVQHEDREAARTRR